MKVNSKQNVMCLHVLYHFLFCFCTRSKMKLQSKNWKSLSLLHSWPQQIHVEVFHKRKTFSLIYLPLMSAIVLRLDQICEPYTLLIKLDTRKLQCKNREQLGDWIISDNTRSTVSRYRLVLTTVRIESVHFSGGKEHGKPKNTDYIRNKKYCIY